MQNVFITNMLNLARAVVSWLMMVMFQSVNSPPNIVSYDDLEKTSDSNYNSNLYTLVLLHFSFFSFHLISNLYYFAEQSLSIFEWLMFITFFLGWLLRFASYISLGEFFMFKKENSK